MVSILPELMSIGKQVELRCNASMKHLVETAFHPILFLLGQQLKEDGRGDMESIRSCSAISNADGTEIKDADQGRYFSDMALRPIIKFGLE